MSIARRSSRTVRSPRELLRIGAVSYLNSKPLIEGLESTKDGSQLVLDYPSRLADGLASGELDVALIPSVECLRHPEYEILSTACVAARGPVLSVKLYSRVPPGEIRTLALDEGSRTSSALVRTYLWHRYGVQPEGRPFPLDSHELDSDSDAILMIGDRAMHAPSEAFHTVWDMGQEWRVWTGLPFVFAVWAARPGGDRMEAIAATLDEARDRGLSGLARIAAREAPGLGIGVEQAREYLERNLHFHLGSGEREGFRLFRQLAVEANIISGESDIVIHDHSTSR